MAAIFYATGMLTPGDGWQRTKGTGASMTAAFEKQYAAAVGMYGDRIAGTAHSPQIEFTEEWTCMNNTNVIPVSLGVLVNTCILLGLDIDTGTKYATMTVKALYTAGLAAPTRVFTHGISLAACFGPTDFLGGTAGTDAKLMTGKISIQIQGPAHFAGDGSTLIGAQIHSPVINGSTSWKGAAPTTAAGAGWSAVTCKPDTSNDDYLKFDVTGEKDAAATAAAV